MGGRFNNHKNQQFPIRERRIETMEKKNVVYSVIMAIAVMFLWTTAAFADTSLEDIQKKLAAAKEISEVTTLADVRAKLKAARNANELQRIKNISKNFGTTDLHALKLTNDSSGDTIGDIANVVSGAGLRKIRQIVAGNGLTMEACKSLKPGFVFYIPTKMIAKDLILNAFEVAKLQKRLRVAEKSNKILKGKLRKRQVEVTKLSEELANVREDLTSSSQIITALNGKVTKLKGVIEDRNTRIGNLEGKLVVANETIVEQKEKLTAMEALGKTLEGSIDYLKGFLYLLGGVIVIIVLFLIVKALFFRKKEKQEKPIEAEEHEEEVLETDSQEISPENTNAGALNGDQGKNSEKDTDN
jgi:hypothetical protein